LYKNGKEELYNNTTDTYEWNNLASQKEFAKIKLKLKEEMMTVINKK
jgi:hypothetical protein